MSQLFAVLGSELLCKWYIFNFKSAVSRPITGFQYFGNFQKNQKNTKVQQNLKNLKSDLLTFLHQYKVILSDLGITSARLLAVLGSQIPCKSHIINFKSAVSQPIAGFQNFRNFQKTRKKTKIQQIFKNLKSSLLSFVHQYEVISSEMEMTCASYWLY